MFFFKMSYIFQVNSSAISWYRFKLIRLTLDAHIFNEARKYQITTTVDRLIMKPKHERFLLFVYKRYCVLSQTFLERFQPSVALLGQKRLGSLDGRKFSRCIWSADRNVCKITFRLQNWKIKVYTILELVAFRASFN